MLNKVIENYNFLAEKLGLQPLTRFEEFISMQLIITETLLNLTQRLEELETKILGEM